MANNFYQKHRERLRKKAHERYQNISEEEKDNSQKNTNERYSNFTEEEKENRWECYQERKQKLPKYRRNCYLTHLTHKS